MFSVSVLILFLVFSYVSGFFYFFVLRRTRFCFKQLLLLARFIKITRISSNCQPTCTASACSFDLFKISNISDYIEAFAIIWRVFERWFVEREQTRVSFMPFLNRRYTGISIATFHASLIRQRRYLVNCRKDEFDTTRRYKYRFTKSPLLTLWTWFKAFYIQNYKLMNVWFLRIKVCNFLQNI